MHKALRSMRDEGLGVRAASRRGKTALALVHLKEDMRMHNDHQRSNQNVNVVTR
jgi:hypothetical protein